MREISIKKKIILGTAQLGMNYGFCKNNLYKSHKNISQILNYANNKKIHYLDTARAYGLSEINIGQFNSKNTQAKKFKIVTKLSNLSKISKKNLKREIFKSVASSLFSLRKPNIDILLIHNYRDLSKHKTDLIKYLNQLQNSGLVKEVGISVYKPKEAVKCLKINLIKHIQIPFNLLDQRWLEKTFKKNLEFRPDVKIHARSIFLQGLLLNKKKYWPKWFRNRDKATQTVNLITKKLKKTNKVDLCLSYVKSFEWINFIVIGINSLEQLKKINKMNSKKKLNFNQRSFVVSKMKDIANNRILLPYKWKHNI